MNNTNDLNLEALNYNKSVGQRLNEIVSPLFTHLGFTHFTYCRFKQGPRYLTLNVDLKLIENYFKTNLDQYVIFNDIDFPKYTRKTVIWDLQQDTPLMAYMRQNGYYHGISIYYRHDDIIEAWHFAADAAHEQINQFYTHDIGYLEQFIVYFQERAHEIISAPEDMWAVFTDDRAMDFDTLQTPKAVTPDSLAGFIDAIRINRFPFEVADHRAILTPAEFDCYHALADGLTLKAIAHQKNISPRTVESHIQNVKNKLEIHSKTRLITEYKKSLYAHLVV